jgi:hypothetical protein
MFSTTCGAALEGIVAELAPAHDAALRALAIRHRNLELAGYAQDEVWHQLADEAAPLGLRYGDSGFLRSIA